MSAATKGSRRDAHFDEIQRIVGAARHRLGAHHLFRGRSHLINVDERNGRLVLTGKLPSFYLKQVLQTALAGIDGVKGIDNFVDVIWPGD